MDDERVVVMLGALAQNTRFNVFRLLMKKGSKGMSAGKIAKALEVPKNTLSAHLNILTNAGLIKSARDGRKLYYSVIVDDTKDFINYLVKDCCDGHPEMCALSLTEAQK